MNVGAAIGRPLVQISTAVADEQCSPLHILSNTMKNKVIYALGFFDGVHIGHQALLRECRRLADEHGCQAAAVTFSSHPDTLVQGVTPRLINTIEDRIRLLKNGGMDDVVVLPFDKQTQSMPWQGFLNRLAQSYQAAGLVCGHDFRFGSRGAGTAQLLADYCREANMPCSVVPEQALDGIPVSSTYIRHLLETGDMEEANRFLGHPHILSGTVISGRKLGRTLGIPTANLSNPQEVVQLPFGVYACKAAVDGKTYTAVTNIGNRPTVGGHRITVEPWLLDFEGDLYGKNLTLSFYAFLRPERKFPDLDALKEEISKNALQTRKIFETNTK